LALLARGLLSASSLSAVIGFRVITFSVGVISQTHTGTPFGHMHPFAAAKNALFTNLSSSEWKLITHIRPSGLSSEGAASSNSFIEPRPSFTAILSA